MSLSIKFLFVIVILDITCSAAKECKDLLPGQYKCESPEIDAKTQSEKGCRKNKTVPVPCLPVTGTVCNGVTFTGNEIGFYQDVPCKYVGEKSYEVALLLSIFLGVFGIDRFYLGYPAIGILKFCTLGFFMIFQLIDVILIATQVLKPADGSDYRIDYFGARIHHISSNNETLFHPQNYL